jgi:hypothetical protein
MCIITFRDDEKQPVNLLKYLNNSSPKSIYKYETISK